MRLSTFTIETFPQGGAARDFGSHEKDFFWASAATSTTGQLFQILQIFHVFFFFYLSFAPGTFLYCTPGQSCTRRERLEGRSKDVTDAEGDQFLLEMKRWRHYVTVSPRLPQVCVVSSTHLVSVYGVVVFH